MSDAMVTLAAVCAGIVAVGTVVAGLWVVLKPFIREQLRELTEKTADIHRQVTENHHSNETPTILDRIDDVAQAVEDVRSELRDHVFLSSRDEAQMWQAIEAVAKSAPPK